MAKNLKKFSCGYNMNNENENQYQITLQQHRYNLLI